MPDGSWITKASVDTTAYTRLQQQLISTRARLDRQVAALIRLNALSDRLLGLSDGTPVADTFAEAVVDVLDVAAGAVWLMHPRPGAAQPEVGRFGVAGPLDEWVAAGRPLLERLEHHAATGAVHLADGLDDILPSAGLVDVVACRAFGRDGQVSGVVLAANTRRVAGLHEPPSDDTRAMLAMLAEKLAAHLDTDASRRLIEEQVIRVGESERQLELVLRGTNDGWWDWDLRTNNCFLSARWMEMTGLWLEVPLLEGFWSDRVHPDDLPAFDRQLAMALSGETGSVEMELRIRREDGTWLPVLVRGTVAVTEDGRPARFAGSILDLSERKRSEAELRRVEAKMLESAKLEALGVLAGGIAHDFNNLLGAILGNIDIARGDLPPDNPVDGYLQSAETAAIRAADLARQMLAYSGRGTFSVVPVSLPDLLGEMGALLASSVAKGARIVQEHDPDLPPVRADITQLRQVALNLIVNASDALDGAPGTITLRTSWTDLAADDPALVAGTSAPPGRYVMLEVTDTGRGMDAATLARVFDPFFSTKSAGRGLGLASALGIVKGHGGAIRVWSTPGEGTRFQVLLVPLLEGEVATGATGGALPASPAFGGRVLLVDDDEGMRTVARLILERAGFTVTEATDGPEAIDRFAAAPGAFVAAVVDVTLPSIDGLEVAAALRATRADLPIVLCSGWSDQEVAARRATLPGSTFLPKPYRSRAMREALARVLDAGAAG